MTRTFMPLNHNRAVDATRLLGYPFIPCHTPADNMVTTFLQRIFDLARPRTVGDGMDILLEQPEYQMATQQKMGVNLLTGVKKQRAGKAFVYMTGGTGGSKELFTHLANCGVGTIVSLHISEQHREKAKENHIN